MADELRSVADEEISLLNERDSEAGGRVRITATWRASASG